MPKLFRPRAFRKKSVFKFPRKLSSRKRAKVSPIKRVVRQEIVRNLEKKSRQNFVPDHPIAPNGDFARIDSQIISCAPNGSGLAINQGVGNGSRVGNKITTKKLVMKGTITPVSYNASTNPGVLPTQVKMWWFWDKTNPTAVPDPAVENDFFQFNNANSGFTNDLADMWKPINTDKYSVVATRTFKIGFSGFNVSPGTLPNFGGFNNNDFKLNQNFTIDLTKHIPKIVKYDDNNASPTTRGLYCMAVATAANSDPIGSGSTLCKMFYILDYTYTDA